MDEPIINQPNNEINNKKCYSCGKVFRTPANLLVHKNRKTPCLIREVPPEQVNNPNRCIFCNKIFKQKQHLTRHLGNCKIKNGGMDMLVDKVRYDQEIRILKEQREQDKKEMERRDEQIKFLQEEMEALKKAIVVPTQPQIVNNTNYNAPVNTNNNTINITINNYNKPTIDGLTLTQEELSNISKLSKYLLQKLYFNPELPQNHCMYLVNKKDKSLLLYDSDWKIVTGENTSEVIKTINGTIAERGGTLVNGVHGPYSGVESQFTKLNPADSQKIFNFNTHTDQLTSDDAYEVFLGGRDTVLKTIKAAGCKLI
ncbi:Zinc finger C2H2-type/integrase DNA-binding protein [Pacmanvirus A23]|uniref:Zinc finger C2H2-type/integrase DNA-binding protein n=1 Tax=Pacmanvirus A23 TaxID=1932881 RepID=UPI000A093611|nr:Zinc finger C2H2-type/integrase DNA-binding protein [Pacmanvirus A23]SIP85841.1 Zinc finger C2H2-type/integrase DNA-binding protein [Pacmanvirus A23]